MKTSFLTLAFIMIAFLSFSQDKPEGLFINSKAKDFKGKDQGGADISTKELRKKNTIVLIFYRGNWDPYDNKALIRFQDSLQLLTAKGATVIAVTPEASEGILKTIEKTKAGFPIIHDKEMKIANAYDVAYEVDERTANRYRSFGNDLLKINEQKEKAFLPVPAVYIINTEGTITYRFFEEDYKRRPSIKEILAEIK